jgi:hypothetical protein
MIVGVGGDVELCYVAVDTVIIDNSAVESCNIRRHFPLVQCQSTWNSVEL